MLADCWHVPVVWLWPMCLVVLLCSDVVLSVAAAATYSVYALSADLIVFMSSIEHRHTLEAAFLSGAAVAASGVLFLSIARRYALQVHLPPLYKQCLRRVRNDDTVKQLIGHRLLVGSQSPPAAQFSKSDTLVPSAPAASSSTVSASGFRVVNCLPPGPRWRRVTGVTYWGWERFWRPRRAQFVVSLSGERGSAVLLAQVDSKLSDQNRLAWLSVESIQPHSQSQSHSSALNTPRRLVLENDNSGWRQDIEHSSKRP